VAAEFTIKSPQKISLEQFMQITKPYEFIESFVVLPLKTQPQADGSPHCV
jgi:hypothetical protein